MKIFRYLYVQVIIAIIIGTLLGIYYKDFAAELKPLSDGFIKLIKMMIIPIIFCTIVTGIAGMEDLKSAGRTGLKAIVYFEIVTTVALIIGLVIVNVIHPGSGMHADAATLDTKSVQQYISPDVANQGFSDFILHLIPENIVSAMSQGNILQVLFFAVLFGIGLSKIGEKAQPVIKALHSITDGLFAVMNMIMKLAPLGALGAIAFTVSKFGADSLVYLGKLMLCFYATCIIFIFVVLGLLLRFFGFNIFSILRFLGNELWVVLGTSSSESALPSLMQKLKKAGCAESVVGLVVPTGYSFNLDGTCIYLTMAAIFISQALDIPLSITQQLYILAILLLTSKGAAGVTGAGFITLAATLPNVEHIPAASVALIFGIDRFMSEARAITNFIGNASATIIISKWEKKMDMEKAEGLLT